MLHHFPDVPSRNQAISVFIRDRALHRPITYFFQGDKFCARKGDLAAV
jgi:hypothetical protein